jgi:hypothetical protein
LTVLGKTLNLFAKGLELDEVNECIATTTAEGAISPGISVTTAFLQNDKDPSADPARYYVLRNCPIPAVNGRYMEGGFNEGSPFYRNVREWAIGMFEVEACVYVRVALF